MFRLGAGSSTYGKVVHTLLHNVALVEGTRTLHDSPGGPSVRSGLVPKLLGRQAVEVSVALCPSVTKRDHVRDIYERETPSQLYVSNVFELVTT